jgi:pilus assembly protein CpaC
MRLRDLLGVALLGTSLLAAGPAPVQAQNLRLVPGTTSEPLVVPMNRAVVVESEGAFSEVSIANPGIADISTLSNRSIYVLGKTPGRTTMTLLSSDGKLLSNVEVQVSPDIAEFKERLKQILPGEQIEVRTANDGIVLSGTVSSAAKLDLALDLAGRYAPDRVSNMMSVGGTQQVMLKVRFAEMQRSVSKTISSSVGGTDGKTSFETGQWLSGSNSINSASNIVTQSGMTAAGLASGVIGGLQFSVLMEALESKGLVRTLAEPNLTALSGQEAKFLAGGEYPVPVAQQNNNVTVEFKPFGVELNFVPTVLDGDNINLVLSASVSSIDTTNTLNTGGLTLSAFKRRQTSTTVEMRDGESFAIAGLLQDDFRNVNGQVPFLGDIPILGALFRSTAYQRAQTELVIIVTPHLVTPSRGEAIALPTDRVRIPSEAELFLLGRNEAKLKGAAGEVARQDFSGSYGYVME